MKNNKKKVLIFGATGNLGAYFVDYCDSHINKDKYEIIAIGRRKTTFFKRYKIMYLQIDITNANDFNKLPKSNVFAIVNLAGILPAYSVELNEIRIAEINFVGSIRILDYAKRVCCDRVLYTQTWAEYAGHWNKNKILSPNLERKLCFTGDHAFYSITKSAIVDSMKYYYEEYNIKPFIFVLPNIYLYAPLNEYYVDGKKKIIAYRYMIDKAIKSEEIEMWGNPNAYKDIVYVKDFCQMLYKGLLAKINGGTYFVGTGIKTTLKEQINGIVSVFSPKNKKSIVIEKPDKSTFVSFVMDIENAKKELGYIPKYDYISYLKDYKKEMKLNRFIDLYK